MKPDNPYPISPWSDSAERFSPDGLFRAAIVEAGEIGMGAPTSGELVVSRDLPGGPILVRIQFCNPSFIWATDSRALAVPRWTRKNLQNLWVVSLPSGRVEIVADEFQVLELHHFEGGIVRGVDSPVYRPRRLAVDVADLIDPLVISVHP